MKPKLVLTTAPHQLDLALDDTHLQDRTAPERHATLEALALLFLEASGAVMTGVADDDA